MSETNAKQVPTELKYGEKFSVAIDALPPASVYALLSRGLTHFMGSEQASKISGKRKEAEEAGTEYSEAAAEADKAKFQTDAWQAMLNGEIGSGNRGPRGTALDTILRRIIVADITAKLKGANLTVPKGDAKVKLGDAEFTMADLIQRAMGREADMVRFRKEADSEMKAIERKANAAKAAADAAGAKTTDALGL